MKDSTFNRLYQVVSLFKPSIDRWVVKSLLGAGLAITTSGLTGVSWYIAIALNIVENELKAQVRNVYGFGTIEWKSVIVGIVICCVGLIIYFLNKWFDARVKRKPKLLIAILHKSIDDFLKPDYSTIRNGYYKSFEIQEINIDQTLTYENGSLNYQEVSLIAQKDINTKIKTLVTINQQYEIAYFGLAHIPLLFLIGTQLADKYNIDFFEYNRKNFSWDYLDEEPTQIDVQRIVEKQQSESLNGIIVIEVSYKIDNSFVFEVVPDFKILCRISLDKISLDSISNRNDISLISNTFRKCVDDILTEYPTIQILHLFYAGSVSLGVNIARKISKRTDPNIIVYNYQRNAAPKYKWGISLNLPNSIPEKLIIN